MLLDPLANSAITRYINPGSSGNGLKDLEYRCMQVARILEELYPESYSNLKF